MAKTQSGWRSPWVIGFIMMGVVLVSANAYLIYLADESAPGLVADNYYERGQDYEQNMLKRMAKDPGWDMQLKAPSSVVLNQNAKFIFTLEDKEGRFVDPDKVVFYAYRPSDVNADFSVPMSKLSAGNYEVEVKFSLKGNWDLLASVVKGEDEFNVSQKLYVKEK